MTQFDNQILCGDCIEILGSAKKPFAKLVFADPPFNIGYQYDRYNDRVKKDQYLAWTKDWMRACRDVITDAGSFYIAIGDDYAAHIRLIGEELGLTLRNWIIWHYTFGQQTKDKFARAHTHIFYFVRDPKNFTYNDFAVRVPSDRQLKYNDRRANPQGKMPDDVWNEYSRVCGTFKERVGWHPCQMPENLLARIIAVSSNAGDLVLDPFNGSGTTTVTARKLNRRFCGIELSEDYAQRARQRIEDIERETCPEGLDTRETTELRRLYADIRIPAREIIADRKLLNLFVNQLHLRMNNCRRYAPEQIAAALMEITW